MQTSFTVRKHKTPAQRERILRAYQRSELPQRDFARKRGIGLSTLQLWLRKAAAGPSAESKGSFISIPNLLAQSASGAPYRLHLGGAMSLEIGSGFRSEELAALLALLPNVCSR